MAFNFLNGSDNIQNLITKKHAHLLWKDELNDPFLLTRQMEIFVYSDTLLGVYAWSAPTKRFLAQIEMEGSRLQTSDFDRFLVPITMLGRLLATDKTRKRPYLKGKLLSTLKERLGHEIIPFRPKLRD